MIVRMYMSRPVVSAQPGSGLAEIALSMTRHGIRRVVIVDESDPTQVVGIVSKHDLLHAYPPHVNPFRYDAGASSEADSLEAREIMSAPVESIDPDAPLEAAARTMRDRKIGALPVVGAQGLVGIVTESDLFRGFSDLLEGPAGSLRITLDISGEPDLLLRFTRDAEQHQLRVHSVVRFEWRGRSLMVLRLQGRQQRAFVDWLWESGYRALNVIGAD